MTKHTKNIKLPGRAVKKGKRKTSSGSTTKKRLPSRHKHTEQELLRLNRLYNVLSRTNQAMIRAESSQELFDEACRIAVEYGAFRMAWVGIVDEKTHRVKPVSIYGYNDHYLDNIHISIDDIPEGRGPTGIALRENRHFICRDIEHEPFMAPWREAALKRGYRSSAGFPLRTGNKAIGVYTVYSSEVDRFDDEEVGLLDELTLDISYALDSMEKERRRQEAEEQLRANERKFRALYDIAPVGISILDPNQKIIDANAALERILCVTKEGLLAGSYKARKYLKPDGTPMNPSDFASALTIHENRPVYNVETGIVTETGETIWTQVSAAPLNLPEASVVIVTNDITAQKQAEEAISKQSRVIESFFSHTPSMVVILDKDFNFIRVNDAYAKSDNRDVSDFPGHNHFDFYPSDAKAIFEQVVREKKPFQIFARPFVYAGHPERGVTYWDWSLVPVLDDSGDVELLIFTLYDVTQRKRAEEKLAASEAELRALFAAMRDVVLVIDREGIYRKIAPTNPGLLYRPPEELLGKSLRDVFPPEEAEKFLVVIQEVLRTQQIQQVEYQLPINGQNVWFVASISPMTDDTTVWVARDITERKQAEEMIRRQLARLLALRAIDAAISSSFDISISLITIIKHLMEQLKVDAAAVLLFHPSLNMLEYGATQGFNTTGLEKTLVRPSDGYAERVILERQLIQVADLRNKPHKKEFAEFLMDENFVWYCGAPLIAKGKIKGILEVWNRSPLQPGLEWLDFLNTLAGQAAIAIESTSLFENLQRSNMDLRVAYDETIEGWSHALDLRDKETEGHTQRVTEMTGELAQLFGLADEELINVRWGSLLHDIGKMGVPDHILLKPDTLTEDEWSVMKKHPQFAYEMLSSIGYLRSAVEIPYCHHEKWDGTGYPRGLKGDQIPLAARIFAVVDIWDAVTSDRPYRKAWSRNEALKYIREQSGLHLDPEVVTAFLKLLENQNR